MTDQIDTGETTASTIAAATTDEPRAQWVRPEVRRMKAGDAETLSPLGFFFAS
ncbi:MAG: hypothetical protein V4618_07420 [Pseudomonadota bacterium]